MSSMEAWTDGRAIFVLICELTGSLTPCYSDDEIDNHYQTNVEVLGQRCFDYIPKVYTSDMAII